MLINTFFDHGLSFLGNSFNARLVTSDLSLQGLVLLQQILDTNQVFAWGKHQENFLDVFSHLLHIYTYWSIEENYTPLTMPFHFYGTV